jgi:hypothetical protein
MKFYEDKTYLLMCAKAQKDIKIFMPKNRGIAGNRGLVIGKYYFIKDTIILKYKDHYIWLPRLHQLIEMMDGFFNGWGLVAILNLASWNNKFTKENLDKFELIEQFLLALIMYSKFNKTWNPITRQWITI